MLRLFICFRWDHDDPLIPLKFISSSSAARICCHHELYYSPVIVSNETGQRLAVGAATKLSVMHEPVNACSITF